MIMEKAIVLKGVSKKYTLYNNAKERLISIVAPGKYGEDFYALRDVDFEADHGEVIGFIGTNGSGKSTLSNIIAGIIPETEGLVQINGQASLIAVAAGLKNDLTGRENIELKLLMLGFTRKEIKEMEDAIIEFSELEKFIDQPVKSYSSGMKSRLGFSISVNVDPEILIIDEALSVGDKAFAEKSLDKMNEFKNKGKTMIFVSHSINQMKKFCDKLLWLEFGKVKMYGDVETVMPEYERFLSIWKRMNKADRNNYRDEAVRGILNYKQFINHHYESKKLHDNKGRFTSKMGRIKNDQALIYSNLDFTDKCKVETEKLLKTYFIKKSANVNNEKYFLLSEKPSSVHGVLGWISEEDLDLRNLTLIDEDTKHFIILGKGRALRKPWGLKKDILYKDLSIFKGDTFIATRTEKVGKSTWYYGVLHDENVWIRNVLLDEK